MAGELGRFENDIARMQTMLDSVSTGNRFTFGRTRSGGFFGVTPVSGNLFFAGWHRTVLYQETNSRNLGGGCRDFVRGWHPAAL